MEEEPVHIIRESTRNLLKLNRQQQRDEVSDCGRCIEEVKISPETVTKIAQKLKTKTAIKASELNILKNGLIEDSNSRGVVLNTHGSLRGLVRELTGYGVKRQCAAAGCLCNLALDNSRACNTVAKASGSYLIAALDNLTVELAVTCAWTLGNLAGSGPKVCDLLISQGALAKLCDMVLGNEDVLDAALYALVHFAYQLKDDLKVEYLSKILQAVTKTSLTLSSSQLLFILSCHQHFPAQVTEDLLQKVLVDLPTTLETHLVTCKQSGFSGKHNNFCCKLVYLVRVLANMDSSEVYIVAVNYFVANNLGDKFSKVLEFNNKSVNDSLLWLLGNLFNCCSDSVFFNSFVNKNLVT